MPVIGGCLITSFDFNNTLAIMVGAYCVMILIYSLDLKL